MHVAAGQRTESQCRIDPDQHHPRIAARLDRTRHQRLQAAIASCAGQRAARWHGIPAGQIQRVAAQHDAVRTRMRGREFGDRACAIGPGVATLQPAVPAQHASGVAGPGTRLQPGKCITEIATRDADAEDIGGDHPLRRRRAADTFGQQPLRHQRPLAMSREDERPPVIVVRQVMVERPDHIGKGQRIGLAAVLRRREGRQRSLSITRRKDPATAVEHARLARDHADVGPVVRLGVGNVRVPRRPAAIGGRVDVEHVDPGARRGGRGTGRDQRGGPLRPRSRRPRRGLGIVGNRRRRQTVERRGDRWRSDRWRSDRWRGDRRRGGRRRHNRRRGGLRARGTRRRRGSGDQRPCQQGRPDCPRHRVPRHRVTLFPRATVLPAANSQRERDRGRSPRVG